MTTSQYTLILKILRWYAHLHDWNIHPPDLQTCAEHLSRSLQKPPSPLQPERIFITRRECAQLLGVSLPTLDRYIREEQLPHHLKNPTAKTRKHSLFSKQDVIQWAKSHLSGVPVRRSPK